MYSNTEDEYEDAKRNYQPRSLKFWTILLGMYLAMFLVALVRLHHLTVPDQL